MDTKRVSGNERRMTAVLRGGVLAGVWAAALAAGAGDVYTNSASGNWSAAASWNGAMPTAGGAADAAIVFNGAGDVASTNNLSGTFLLNRLEAAAGTVTLWGNMLSFVDSGASGPQVEQTGSGSATFRNLLSLASDTVFNVASGVLTVCPVSGAGALVKTGAGELLCATNGNGALSFTGATRVEGGTLTVATSTGRFSMSSPSLTVENGATLRIFFGTGVNALNLPGSASVTVASGGTLLTDVPTISCGTFNAASGATVAGGNGCLSLHAVDAGGSAVSTLGSLSLTRIILEPYSVANPTQTVRFDGTGPGLSIGTDSGRAFSLRTGASGSSGLFTFVMDIADSPAAPVDLLVPFLNFRPSTSSSGFDFVKRGAGVMQVNGLDWSLATAPTQPVDGVVEAGTLIWNTSAANGAGVNLATVTVDSGATLQVGAGGTAGAIFVDAAVNGTLAFNRSNAYLFTPAVSGTGRLVQKGSGTLTLNGTHTYSGGTEVESGTLLVAAPGALNGAGTVAVTGGTLGGDGTVGGPVAVTGGGVLLPGGSNTVGTLTLANTGAAALTLSGGRLLCDLATVAGSCDRIDVAGTLALSGTNRLALAFTAGTPPAGTYTLLTYAARSGTGVLVLDRPYPNATLTVGATAATLTVTGAGITYLTWTGAASGTWDTTTANWTLLGTPSTYTAGDAVLFNDAAAVFTVAASGAVAPSSVTFDNSDENYEISAILDGTETSVIKMGSKSATLSGVNTYGGGTILAGGFLTVGSTANLPAGPLTFQGGILRFTGAPPSSLGAYAVNWDSFNGGLELTSGTLTLADAISGGGSLSKSGAGTLVLSGANSFRGGTAVNAGFLRMNHAHALGAGDVAVAVGGQVDLTGNLTVTNAVSIKGVGATSSGEGAIRSVNGTTNTWSGPVTIAENSARIGCTGGGLLEVSGVINSGANVYEVVVRMPNDTGGTLLLSANNTWLGSTWIRCGTIKLGIDHALPTGSVLRLGLGAGQTGVTNSTLDLAGFNQSIAGVTDVGTDNLHTVTNTEETPSTLTINNTAAYTFAGEFTGNLDVVKTGSSTLTLSGVSSTSGGLIVSNGNLVVSTSGSLGSNSTNITVAAGTLTLQNSAALADEASLRIADGGGAKVNLAAGVNESVGYLYFGDKLRMGGTYGATGSGARILDDEHFSGSGILTVRHGNGGTLIRLQ